jgi:hypothetical protein
VVGVRLALDRDEHPHATRSGLEAIAVVDHLPDRGVESVTSPLSLRRETLR